VIIPLVCHRSEKKQVNTERLERIVISAIKQSVKAYKPIVRPVLTFNEFIDQPVQGCKYIAHCFGENRSLLSNACLPGRDATILIGPEGDFTEAEVSKAIEASYVPVSLGSSRLRTETAAVVACTTISIINDNNY
jgi:16S rRNA (uracil1498-N3)-methyltransferase